MRNESQRTIDGQAFRARQLGCEDAEDLLIDLLKLAGPSMANALGGLDVAKIKEQGIGGLPLDSQAIVGAIREFTGGFDKDLYRSICQRLARVTTVQVGEKWPSLEQVQSEIFRGRLLLKWRWLAFAVEAQFGGFFDELQQLLPAGDAAGEGAASSSSSPSTSDGEFGESSPTPG